MWVLLLSVAVRIVALAMVWHMPLTADARDYVYMAGQLVRGVHFVPYWPAGLPLYLAPWVAAGAGLGVLRASMLLFWLIAAWGLYRLAKVTGTAGVAWLVLLVFALSPGAIQLSIAPLTQLPVAALLLVALSAALRCAEGAGWGEFLLLGASLGWMTLIRPSALVLFVLVAIPVWRRRRWAGAVVALVLGGVLIGGWLVRSHELSGAWVMNTANGQNFWDGNNPWTPMYRTWFFGSHAKPGTDEIDQYPAYKQQVMQGDALPSLQQPAHFETLAKSYIKAHPGVFALRTFNRIRCFWGFDVFTSETLRHHVRRLFWPSLALEFVCYMLLVGTAVFWMAASGTGFWRRWDVWVVLATVVLYAAPYWLSMSHPTYHFPVIVPVALLGALAWSSPGVRSLLRGWIAFAVLLAIQAEWVYQMARASIR